MSPLQKNRQSCLPYPHDVGNGFHLLAAGRRVEHLAHDPPPAHRVDGRRALPAVLQGDAQVQLVGHQLAALGRGFVPLHRPVAVRRENPRLAGVFVRVGIAAAVRVVRVVIIRVCERK